MLENGDRVKLDVDRMTARKEWKSLNPDYRQFVLDNRDAVFTVKIRRRGRDGTPVIIDFAENDAWSFWAGDLIPGEKRGW